MDRYLVISSDYSLQPSFSNGGSMAVETGSVLDARAAASYSNSGTGFHYPISM